MNVTCKFCGKTFDVEQLDSDEFDAPRWCPECGKDDWKDMSEEALRYAESIGVYEYEVQGQYMEYWSFFTGEGFRFIRRNLITDEEDRETLIPWTPDCCWPTPRFLRTEYGATRYNYNVG